MSNHSDSGLSDTLPNLNDMNTEEPDAMDCTISDLSTLNIGNARECTTPIIRKDFELSAFNVGDTC